MDFGRIKALRYVNIYTDACSSEYRLVTCTTPPLIITNKLLPGGFHNAIHRRDCIIFIEKEGERIRIRVEPRHGYEGKANISTVADEIILGMFPQISEMVLDIGRDFPHPANQMATYVDYDTYMEGLENKITVLAKRGAASTIQERYRDALLNPYCALGFKNINRQYDDLMKM